MRKLRILKIQFLFVKYLKIKYKNIFNSLKEELSKLNVDFFFILKN